MRKDPFLWVLILLGAGLRFWKVGGDLPYVLHYDEPTLIDNAVWLLQNGSLNPHFFNYPTGLIYILALLFGVVLLLGQITGRFAGGAEAIAWLSQGTYPQPADGGVLYFYPTVGVPALYLIGRSVSAIAGTLAIPVLYALALRAEGSRVTARLAALFLALSPLAVEHAHLITTDTAAMAMATLALLAVCKAEGGQTRRWVIAGALAGLAAGIKYNAGFVVLPLVFLAVWRWKDGITRGVTRLGIAGISAILVFLLTTPFALFDARAFLHDLGSEFHHVASVSEPFKGAEAVAAPAIEKMAEIFRHHLGLLGFLAACWGAIAALASRRFSGVAIVIFVAVGLLPLTGWKTFYARYLLIFWPAILLLTAWGLGDLTKRLAEVRSVGGRWRDALTAVLVLLVLFVPTRRLIAYESRRLQPDPRIEMTEWIEANIPEGEPIVLEREGPFLKGDRYTLEYVEDIRGPLNARCLPRSRCPLSDRDGTGKACPRAEAYSEIFENLEAIRADSEQPWYSGSLIVYRLTGEAAWEEPAQSAIDRGDLKGAISAIEVTIRGGEATPFAWKTLAQLRFATADTVGAIEAYQEAALLNPNDAETLLALSSLFLARAEWDASIAELARARSLAPDDPLIFNNLAVAHLYRARDLVIKNLRDRALEDWKAAREYAAACVQKAPGDRNLAQIAEQVERMGERWGFR